MRLKLGLAKPKQSIFGFEMAGQFEAVGSTVTRFQPGDRVVASRGFDFGCHAEHVTVAEQGAIARIPESLSYQDAVALCFGGTTALDGQIRSSRAVSGPPASPVLGVLAGSIRRTWASSSAFGQCSTPRGTT
jgi:NADPH:quinone reductase-like Zn-dependent oxidoreductase